MVEHSSVCLEVGSTPRALRKVFVSFIITISGRGGRRAFRAASSYQVFDG